MADSLPEPWICAYLIDTAETFGGSLSNVPYREKKRKVQLVDVRRLRNLMASQNVHDYPMDA